MAADGLARRAALWWHRAVARSRFSTRLYCKALIASRSLLPPQLAARLYNNLQGVSWPEVDLPPTSVQVGASTEILLHPHLGEFDGEALVRRRLTYEPEVFAWLESRVALYDVIVEIGANVGVFTVFFSRCLRAAGANRARVFAFEPSREAYRRLVANVAANDASNVIALNVAIGATTALADFHQPKGHLTNGSLVPGFARLFSEAVTVQPVLCLSGSVLSELVPTAERTLLKIDVEGAESSVLDSLAQFIAERTPDIVLEVLPGYEQQIAMTSPLRTGAFALYQITPAGPVRRAALEGGDYRDWWLTPER